MAPMTTNSLVTNLVPMYCANWKAWLTSIPISHANGNITIPSKCCSESQGLMSPSSLLIKLARATKAMTLAAMISTNLPAPRIESPKNEKNGSFSVFRACRPPSPQLLVRKAARSS